MELSVQINDLQVMHPLATHVAQNQRYTTDDENECRTELNFHGS